MKTQYAIGTVIILLTVVILVFYLLSIPNLGNPPSLNQSANLTAKGPSANLTAYKTNVNCGSFDKPITSVNNVTNGEICFLNSFRKSENATLEVSVSSVDTGGGITLNTQLNGTSMYIAVDQYAHVNIDNENAEFYCNEISASYNSTSKSFDGLNLSSCKAINYSKNRNFSFDLVQLNQTSIFVSN
jgi:hypothetical protein